MKASVIIPTKNPGALFRQVLSAVLAQETGFGYEVLIVDSGSTDGSVEYVDAMADERLRLHRIPPSEFGHGRTRNLAISLCRGEFAVLITHDALPADAHWLARLVSMAESDGRIAGVFGRHIAYPSASPYTHRELETHFAGFQASPIVALDDPALYAREEGYRKFLHFFSNNNSLIRRSVWEAFPFPEVDFAEDQAWAKDIIEAGFSKAYADDAVVYHSHDFSLIEKMQRSFDEAHAFRRYFGYRLCPTFGMWFRGWTRDAARDLKGAFRTGIWRTHPGAVMRRPLEHLMRSTGHWLGTHGHRLPSFLAEKLSWDRRLLVGLRSGAAADVEHVSGSGYGH